MLEKKTTKEIFLESKGIQRGFLEAINTEDEFNKNLNEVWVSQESLKIDLKQLVKDYESLRGEVSDELLDGKIETVKEIIRRIKS